MRTGSRLNIGYFSKERFSFLCLVKLAGRPNSLGDRRVIHPAKPLSCLAQVEAALAPKRIDRWWRIRFTTTDGMIAAGIIFKVVTWPEWHPGKVKIAWEPGDTDKLLACAGKDS